MKTPSSLVIIAVSGLLASSAAAADSAAPSKPAAPSASSQQPSSSPRAADQSASATAQAPANPALAAEKTAATLAESKATEKAIQQHVRPKDPFVMETPPPAPRPETKPESPVAGYVWVPGHWAAVKGDWQWTPGVWALPATPSSIWMPAKYDEKTKQWSAGYWQPDRPAPTESQPPSKESPTASSSPY